MLKSFLRATALTIFVMGIFFGSLWIAQYIDAKEYLLFVGNVGGALIVFVVVWLVNQLDK